MPKGQRRGRSKGLEVDFDIDESSGIEKYTYADKVTERLTKLGVTRNNKPRIKGDHESIFSDLKTGEYFDGRLPTVIRQLTLDQLSALYSLFSNWYGYLMFQTRKVATERSEAMTQKKFLWGLIRQQKKLDEEGKKRTPQAMSDAATSDVRFVEANAKYEEVDCLYECLEAMTKVASQDMKVISREVTIQQTKMENDGSRGRLRGRSGFRPKTYRPREEDDGEEEDELENEANNAPSKKRRKQFRRSVNQRTFRRR